MHYMLLFNETPEEHAKRDDPAEADRYWGGWTAYIGAIAQSGAMVSGNGLQPPDTSTTIRVENGRRQIVVGPYCSCERPGRRSRLWDARWSRRSPGGISSG